MSDDLNNLRWRLEAAERNVETFRKSAANEEKVAADLRAELAKREAEAAKSYGEREAEKLFGKYCVGDTAPRFYIGRRDTDYAWFVFTFNGGATNEQVIAGARASIADAIDAARADMREQCAKTVESLAEACSPGPSNLYFAGAREAYAAAAQTIRANPGTVKP